MIFVISGLYSYWELGYEKSREMADKYGVGIQIHLAETNEGVEKIRRDHGGKRVFEYMKDLGVLGPDVMAAHCV